MFRQSKQEHPLLSIFRVWVKSSTNCDIIFTEGGADERCLDMGQRTSEVMGSGRVLFCCSRGVSGKIWMNPMRPSFDDFSSPLPRPNHPKGILVGWLGRGSGEVWGQTLMNPMRPLFICQAMPTFPSCLWGGSPKLKVSSLRRQGSIPPVLMVFALMDMDPKPAVETAP